MMVLKRKQIVILALILLIVVAGYLQYSYRQGSTSADSEGRLGEALYVDSDIYNDEMFGSDSDLADEGFGDQVNITASKMANDYFIQAKMDKEQSRSEAADSLKAIVEDATVSTEIREEAHNKMMALAENLERESRIEILINKMGFEDSFILFADNGSVDIIVKTPSLTSSQAAQITDIVMRQADVDVEDIHISTMF
ncbi:MAG: SpoIIIAH-like family protein [Acetivibrionales bacterium]|jgi:stage III sporulation protein AH|nr:SpoIIIAH-like family protein [Bacillota bacterium]NLP06798.1 SpoIIIAH-like family protein [Clostridiaceae bacterium]HOA54295.1 SpoIIIAH-like family protein [Clostridiales bacterium]HQD30642.1 SpoIIIAH-like family protein [Clostridiales bacterium]